MGDSPHRDPRRGPPGRGIIAGLVGGTVLAIWFLVIDGLAGRPFHTPAFLARVLLGADLGQPTAARIVLYTAVHYAAFLPVGIAAASLRDRIRFAPVILMGAVRGCLLFDLGFYGGVWLTGTDVVGYLGWPEVLVGNVLAGIGVLGAVDVLSPRPSWSWREVLADHTTVREGLSVGAVGAFAVALWFLVIDGAAGRFLFTPAALGSIVFHGAAGPADVRLDAVTVFAYTGLHLAAFLGTGLIAAAIVALAEDRHPYILLGAVLLFVTFETFFTGLVAIVGQWLLEVIPWWSIAGANLVAAVGMGYFLWRRHPGLATALGQPELERDVAAEVRDPAFTPSGAGRTEDGPGTP